MTLEELFAGKDFDLEASRARLLKLMKEEGLPYGIRTHTYNSRLAQELTKWAELRPGDTAIYDVLFRAYFVDGVNIAEVDRLVEISGAIGLPPEQAREVLETRSYSVSVDDDWQRASELGVTGVPTFVMNGKGLVGAQSYDVLEDFVERAGAGRNRRES